VLKDENMHTVSAYVSYIMQCCCHRVMSSDVRLPVRFFHGFGLSKTIVYTLVYTKI